MSADGADVNVSRSWETFAVNCRGFDMTHAGHALEHLGNFRRIHIASELPAGAVRPAGQRMEEGIECRQCSLFHPLGFVNVLGHYLGDNGDLEVPRTNDVHPCLALLRQPNKSVGLEVVLDLADEFRAR